MPELPEVETIRKALSDIVEDSIIVDIQKFRDNLRFEFPKFLDKGLVNTKIVNIKRRAKYLLFELNNGYSLISHLGMSGCWNVKKTLNQKLCDITRDKHDHFAMILKDNKNNFWLALYNDPRRFGFMLYEQTQKLNQNKFLEKLGIEPLDDELKGTMLYKKFIKKNISFKAALLDQTIIAGLGNIYVCEALWRSKISPFTKVNEFCTIIKNSEKKLQILCDNIKDILREALMWGGSTLKDYKNIDGGTGYFQHQFAVYGKAGNNCSKCSGVIEKVMQNGRSSFFCKTCQPLLNKEI